MTLNDAQRDAEGRFPGDASADDLVVHQQDIEAVLNAMWSAGAEAIQMQDQRIIATSAPLCVGNTLLLNGRTYSPPYVVTAIGDASAMQALISGQVDAIGCSTTVAAQIDKRQPNTFEPKFVLKQQEMAVAMRPGQDALLKSVNDFVAKNTANGELNKLYRKWLETDLPKMQ